MSALQDSGHRQPPVLVAGAHRTGTTWVGKMLAAAPGVAYISEPLNVLHRPGVMRAPVRHWYTYICADNEAEYLPALGEMLAYHYHLWAEIRSLRSRKDVLRMGRDGSVFFGGRLFHHRPLIKDPFAVFSIPWFTGRLGCQAVVTVRHPAAFASSLKRLDWPFDFNDLLGQPLLMRDLLEPFRPEMEAMAISSKVPGAPTDIIAQAALLWQVVYTVVDRYMQSCPGLQLVRHEDLSLDPPGGYRALYQALDLAYTPQVEQTILNSSSSENPGELSKKKVHSVRLDSRANLHNWKRRLEPGEIARIRQLTEGLAARFYPDISWD